MKKLADHNHAQDNCPDEENDENPNKKELSVKLDDAEWAKRKAAWKKPEIREKRGVLAKYARTVKSASEGATTG